MKTRLLLAIFLISATSLRAETDDGQMSKKDRKYVVNYLKETKQNLFNTINGLSTDQWAFKPTQDVWSIAQICDHIYNAEQSLTKRYKSLMEGPSDFEKKIDLNDRIEFVLNFISEKNRETIKIPVAPGTEPQPEGMRWQTPEEFVRDFRALRDDNIEFVKTTQAPLLAHYNPLIERLGEMNSYLWVVFMSAHSSRHTYQIKEVMEHDKYPGE